MDKKIQPETAQSDDALFETLNKNKKRKKRRIIITVVCIVAVLLLAAVVGVILLRQQVRQNFATQSGEVLSVTATTGTIQSNVSGSGKLTETDLEAIAVPEGVEILKVLVKANTTIKTGDVLATVDMATVKSVMAETQAQIDQLDQQIRDAEADEVDKYIYAGVSGRVKEIFAQKDTEVADAMYENGALALLSLDGYMSVTLEAEGVAQGDKVTVTLADGDTVSGTVEAAGSGTITVLVSDNGPAYLEEVTVATKDGTALGSGKLEIHNPLRITGYAGTVAAVNSKLNAKVSDGTKLFTLKNTSHSANYDALLRSRSSLEETLLELLTIQRDGAVCAPMDGSVTSIDYTEGGYSVATLSPDQTMTVTITVDETDILSLEVGQTVSVTVSSVDSDAFYGTLTELNKTASDGSYSAVVTLDKQEGMLAGMTAQISVQISGGYNAVLIPVAALHKTSTGAYVYTGYNEEYQEYTGRVDVVIGLENSTYVEIKEGLQEGDTVYYTEQQSSGFGGFGSGNMPNFGGDQGGGNMPNFGGGSGNMPNFGGGSGNMPNFGGGSSGGNMPNFGGGSSGGSRPGRGN